MHALLAAVSLITAPVSVNLPLQLTPPAPPAFTQAISQTVAINGQNYTVAGTLTFTPTGTVAVLPLLPGSVEFPKGSGLTWTEGHLPGFGFGPLGTWSMKLADGSYPDPFAPPFSPLPPTTIPAGKALAGRYGPQVVK